MGLTIYRTSRSYDFDETETHESSYPYIRLSFVRVYLKKTIIKIVCKVMCMSRPEFHCPGYRRKDLNFSVEYKKNIFNLRRGFCGMPK